MSALPYYPWHAVPWQRLQQTKKMGRLPHALLLTGAAGLGKATFAKNFVKALYCVTPSVDGLPCHACPPCRQFDSGALPDTYEIYPAEGSPKSGIKKSLQIGIDNIRPLANFLSLSSVNQQYRSVIIHPAECMTEAAMNALLKTLEEPTGNALLLLVCSEPKRLLPTIKSRCQTVFFTVPTEAQALKWLSEHGGLSSGAVQPSDKNRALALALAHSSPLKAQQWLQKNDPYSLEALHEVMLKTLFKQNSPLLLGERYDKKDITGLLELLSLLLLDVLTYNSLAQSRSHSNVSSDVDLNEASYKQIYRTEPAAVERLSHVLSVQAIWQGLEKIKTYKKYLPIALNKRLFLDDVFIELTK